MGSDNWDSVASLSCVLITSRVCGHKKSRRYSSYRAAFFFMKLPALAPSASIVSLFARAWLSNANGFAFDPVLSAAKKLPMPSADEARQ